jgi:hypothetical protein
LVPVDGRGLGSKQFQLRTLSSIGAGLHRHLLGKNADLVAQRRAATLSKSAARYSRPPALLPHAGRSRPLLRTSTAARPVRSRIQTAPSHGLNSSDGDSVQPNRSAKPGVPWIPNLTRFRVMGFALTSCITKIGFTSDSVRTLPAVELWPLHPRSKVKSFLCRDAVDCITATLRRPESAAGERTGLSD